MPKRNFVNSDDDLDGDQVDIEDILVSKRKRTSESDSDDNLGNFIHDSITHRNIKQGISVLKQTGQKAKLQKGEVGGGSFQSMGLHPSLLRSLVLQGFRIPTPIQRLAIPALLASPPRDLVGMARTGSGKSLAYLIPLVQRLGGRHSSIFGARSLILLPTRELALQILKVGKELSRAFNGAGGHAGDKADHNSSKSQSLRWSLIVGGESLDEQFEMISSNPDIIIATPGRLLHLIVEMNLDLKSVEYVVFDEADRLFEMGFETALTEILQRLPAARQTLLFSATLPKSLVEFAKAGLQEPKLVRLDSESKISTDLRMAFFSVKQHEKDAALLYLLRDVIKVPLGGLEKPHTRDGKGKSKEIIAAPHQTLVFAATKHHVEYLTHVLTAVGYSVAYIYGSLNQVARSQQMEQFRQGRHNILVVTDVAARGIDIPVLENVVNYDFPQGARVYVHRVGRTARAGRTGWAWSFVTHQEMPYLLDLQLFLGSPLVTSIQDHGDASFCQNLVVGTFDRERLDEDVESIRSLDDVDHSLSSLREVMKRGHGMYERSKGKASPASYKRAKDMAKDPKWSFSGSHILSHPVLMRDPDAYAHRTGEAARQLLLNTVNAFRPLETVLEARSKVGNANAVLMKERRKALQRSASRSQIRSAAIEEELELPENRPTEDVEIANEEEIAAVFKVPYKNSFKDSDFFMSYEKADVHAEKGYSLRDGASSFTEQAQGVSFDLAGDDALAQRRKNQLNWDKKKKKFVKGDGVGADNMKMVRTENGVRLPATYRSGRYDEWKSKNRISLPKVGEEEAEGPRNHWQKVGSKRFKHNKTAPSKPLDKLRTDYERKSRQTKNKEVEPSQEARARAPPGRKARTKFGGNSKRTKTELKNPSQIRKARQMQDHRKAKNARPTRQKR